MLIVLAILAIASGAAVMALRDGHETRLEQDAMRLAAVLEVARAKSRATGVPIAWRSKPSGFAFEPAMKLPSDAWQDPSTLALVLDSSGLPMATDQARLVLGPEPVIGAQSVRLKLGGRAVVVSTDGLRPFRAGSVQPEP